MNLRQRATEPELMDDLTLASDALRQNLDELEVINTRLGGYGVVTDALSSLRAKMPPDARCGLPTWVVAAATPCATLPAGPGATTYR